MENQDKKYYVFTNGHGGIITDDDMYAEHLSLTLGKKTQGYVYDSYSAAQHDLREHMEQFLPSYACCPPESFPMGKFIGINKLLDMIGYRDPMPEKSIFSVRETEAD